MKNKALIIIGVIMLTVIAGASIFTILEDKRDEQRAKIDKLRIF